VLIGGQAVAFFKKYINVSKRDHKLDALDIERHIETIRDRVEHIYFIPTKYRVYYKFIIESEQNKENTLPNRQWELIEQIGSKLNIRTTDLTPLLIEESESLLSHGKFTFWRDDTHWNKYGISIAAKLVKKNLSASK